MYLKRLEVHGFKTFAQRTVFEFPAGVTAIVGPNGSGKSNVADVLRWVLGEQSYSNLRAKRTEDVLYSGGRGRAPNGFAEAWLTIDNSDRLLPLPYDEVMIGRRAYRNGENEYTINRARVRLRDVLDAVAPLGSSYTIINQGLVDLALALQPEERRRLFEDAAEIGPYQSKRAEAERRLRETETNLLRLSDLLSELEPQLRTLKRQARDAEAVGAVETELGGLLRGMYWSQWQTATERLERATSAHERAVVELDAARAQREQAGAELQRARDTARAGRAELEELQAVSAAIQSELQAAERDYAVAVERNAGVERTKTEARQRLADLLPLLETTQSSLVSGEASRENAAAELEQARAALDNAERAARREQAARRVAEAALASQRLAALQAQAAIERARGMLGELEHRSADGETEAEALSAAIERQRQLGDTRSKQAAAAARTLEAAEAAIGAAQAAVDELRGRIEQLRGARDNADEQVVAARRELSELQARLEALSRLARAREGAFAGVRAAMEWAEREGRGFALVSSLLRVPPELETAVEVALGSRLQNIVVDTWADAEAAIAQLKRSGAGRATFLPLDTLRGGRRPAPPAMPGIRGIAAELVEVDQQARPIAAALLGRTLLADDLAAARRALRELDGGWTIVTLGGESIAGGGALTGGAATRESGVLRRERELRELPERVALAGEAAARAQTKRDAAAGELEAAHNELQAAESRLWEQRRRRDAAQREAEAQRRELHRSEDALEALEKRRVALEREAAALANQRSAALGELAGAEQAYTAAQHAVAGAEDEAGRLAGVDEQLSLRQHEHRAAQAEAELRHVVADLEAQRAALGRARSEQRQLQARSAELSREAELLARQLEHANERQAQLQGAFGAANERLSAAVAARREADAVLQSREEREREFTTLTLRCDTLYAEALLELQRRQVEHDALLARAAEDSIDLETAQPLPLDASSVAELLPRVEQLRGRLRRMGPVNMLAPEEYRAAAERYEFLSGQLADVRSAAAALHEAIGKLDHVMQQHFSATFEAVAGEFGAAFTQLFGGGSARLVLQSPSDDGRPAGIDIIAQPPGKRQLNLQLLSGGERALTAAALLFAILKVNPSPFCILDEVDAALDEANVVRFREALLGLTGATQFIIITHNRGTVEVADTLYGISMADDGTSRVLSLRVEEIDESLQLITE